MEAVDKCVLAILTPRKRPTAPAEQEDECAPELVLTFREKKKILFRLPGIEHRYLIVLLAA